MPKPSTAFVKVDASFLPAGFSLQGDEGLVATFYPDGQLERLCVFEAGEVVSSELRLAQGIAGATMYDRPSPGSSRNWSVYRKGAVESFDAWSDNSRPSPTAWAPWVTTQIECIRKEWEAWKAKDPPLFRAIRLGNEAKFAELLEFNPHGSDSPNADGRTPLIEAARFGHLGMVQCLLDRGADVNAQQRVWHIDLQKWVKGETALSAACASGQLDVARILIEHNANLELVDVDGQTPLVRAAAMGHVGIVRLLVESGALLVSKKPPQGPSALHAAVLHVSCVELLLDAGFAVDTPDGNGWTPLLYAVHRKSPISVLRLLMTRGANLQASRADGSTVLHFAIASGRPEVVELLIEHGADRAARTKAGKTPLDEALGWQNSKYSDAPQADRDRIVTLLQATR